MKPPEPIHIPHLLPKIDRLLIEFLENLSPEDWNLPTLASQWTIKDIAVHLLDGNLRALSMLRDNFFGEVPGEINSYQDMVSFLNKLNHDWVVATKRLSPRVIIDLLKSSGQEYCDFITTLNPEEKAVFSVAWAGENESKNWFHIAREYTEKWHHQQQIRFAVNPSDSVLLANEWYYPYLNTSVRGLPHHFREVNGEDGDTVKFTFKGASEKNWFLKRMESKWELLLESDEKLKSEVIIKDEIAWRIFTKGIKREEVIKKSIIKGDERLGAKIFDMLAVMA